jgi:hypothetical protein
MGASGGRTDCRGVSGGALGPKIHRSPGAATGGQIRVVDHRALGVDLAGDPGTRRRTAFSEFISIGVSSWLLGKLKTWAGYYPA